jgi:hypothetical protein
VLAAAAAHWALLAPRLPDVSRQRLVALLARLRAQVAGEDGPAHRETAGQAARLLVDDLPPEVLRRLPVLAEAAGARYAGPVPDTVPLDDLGHQGHRYDDLAVLLVDGNRMVGPVLGPVRRRLLAFPAHDEETVRRAGTDTGPDGGLIALRGEGGRLRLPAFQFTRDGTARPAVLRVNRELNAARDPWGSADWWLAGNSWLDGRPPADLLDGPGEHLLMPTARLLADGD